MSERSQNRFPSENGWAVGNINMGPTFHPPQYHSVPSEIPNFTNSVGPPQVPYPLNNVSHSSDSLKRNPEPMKFNSAICPPYANDVNSFECVRMDNLKQQNTTNSYNHVPIFSHPLHSSNHAGSNFTPSPPVASCIANDTKNFTSIPASQGTYLGAFNSNSLPIEQPNSFHNQPSLREVVPFQNLHGYQPHPTIATIPPQPLPNMFAQRQIYNVPPPAIRCSSTVESTSGGNFQQFVLPPQNFAPEPLQYNNIPSVAPPAYPRLPFPSQQVQPYVEKPGSEKERLLTTFLENLRVRDKETTKSILTVVEFRSTLKIGLSLTKTLLNCKQKLTNSLHCDKDEWNREMHYVNELKKQLSSLCSVLSSPDNLSAVQKRLMTIKKKRALKSRLKQEASFCRLQRARAREELHQEIDKWLDGIKEKNLKLKREAEMKKEADNILAEVRRKIHEVKRATEKLKVFEKLRATRQVNAEQKGLFVASEHGARFVEQMGMLRSTLATQLLDYEGEEHALRVMLEAEQEGQLEQEALWRLRKTKAMQRKKQQAILEGLFGHTDEPSPADPLFLFYQHQNAGNCSIDALVQIRHHWDVHLAENGGTVPQQWVVPFPPNSATWEVSLEIT